MRGEYAFAPNTSDWPTNTVSDCIISEPIREILCTPKRCVCVDGADDNVDAHTDTIHAHENRAHALIHD